MNVADFKLAIDELIAIIKHIIATLADFINGIKEIPDADDSEESSEA